MKVHPDAFLPRILLGRAEFRNFFTVCRTEKLHPSRELSLPVSGSMPSGTQIQRNLTRPERRKIHDVFKENFDDLKASFDDDLEQLNQEFDQLLLKNSLEHALEQDQLFDELAQEDEQIDKLAANRHKSGCSN